MSEKRSRYFCLISYLSIDIILSCLKKNKNIKHYACIVHDKDLDQQGNIKIIHTHIVIHLYNAVTLRIVRQWFSGFYDDKGLEINTLGQYINSNYDILDYLIHKNNQDKYQYSLVDIISDDLEAMYNNEILADNCYEIITMLLEKKKLLDIVKKYGKDFVYHYSCYKEICKDIDYQESISNMTVSDYSSLPRL